MSSLPERPPNPSSEDRFRAICEDLASAFDAAFVTVLHSGDPSGPHRTRVALRRLTTALDAFLPILRRKQAAVFRARAKWIFRALGPLRDSDVHLPNSIGSKRYKAKLEQNGLLREKTRERVGRERAAALTQDLRVAIAENGPIFRRSSEAVNLRRSSTTVLARQVLGAAWDRCCAYGGSIQEMDQRLRHDFRKEIKSLRYLSEFFAEQFPGLTQEPFRSDFREIQDLLGALNDFEVGLVLDGRKRPRRLPKDLRQQLAMAGTVWARLASAIPPWQDQAIRHP